MKQTFIKHCVILVIMAMLVPLATIAQEIPVAILETNDDGAAKTLTFTYADKNTLHQPGDGMNGTYELNDEHSFPGWVKLNGGNDSITAVVFEASFAEARPTSTRGWFRNMPNLATIEGLEFLNTEEVTDMSDMFYGCKSLKKLDLMGFNTTNVTNMSDMFSHCEKLTSLDVSGFNTVNVTSMSSMFYDCVKLETLDVSGFNTLNVKYMAGMFTQCRKLTNIDVSKFNTSNLLQIAGMFQFCNNLKSIDISNFDLSKVQDVSWLFYCCDSLKTLNVGDIDFGKLALSKMAFGNVGALWPCYLITGSGFNVSVLGEKNYFGCYDWEGGCFSLSRTAAIPVAQVTFNEDNKTKTLKFLCKEVDLLKRDECLNSGVYPLNASAEFPKWIPGDYDYWWEGDETFTVVEFDESFAKVRPTTTWCWFYKLTKLDTIKGMEYLNTSEVISMDQMFYGCSSLKGINLKWFDTSKVIGMYGMFNGCSGLEELDVSGFDTRNAVRIGYMFSGCSSLVKLDVSGFVTDKVTDMGGMFKDCRKLASIDVTNFNTENVTDMSGMFSGCNGITSLDLSSFKTDNVTTMDDMFGCAKLTSLDVSGFNTAKVTTMREMFSHCSSLTSLDLSNFNTSNVTDMRYMFQYCSKITSLDISMFDLSKVTRDNLGALIKYTPALSRLNLGSNDFKGFSFDRLLGDFIPFTNVGSPEKPCELIVDEKFDRNVLGSKITDGNYSYYKWYDGYFSEPIVVTTGIGTASAVLVGKDAPAYNLSGQRVGNDYNGVVIVNGRKYVRK